MTNKEAKIAKLIQAGGKRWTKNGHDRIYLRNAIKGEDGMSGSVSRAFWGTVDKTYYDINKDELVYNHSSWEYVNNRIEEEFARILNETEVEEKDETAELIQKIVYSSEWVLEDLAKLCSIAGLEKEWNESNGDTFDQVVCKALEVLGVEI